MLFNSLEFLLVFLPLVLACFFALQHFGLGRWKAALLFAASLVFYAWWSAAFSLLLLLSIAANFAFGMLLLRYRSRWLLGGAIGANLLLLGYFKYANFLIGSVNALCGMHLPGQTIVLPLGISFYTFTQIAFLVDAYQSKVEERSPLRYALFVSFFPHLIAGPILHHREMTVQFRQFVSRRVGSQDIALGMTMFAIGLFKKVVLADTYSPFVHEIFDGRAHAGTFVTAWLAAISYALQLYFDFSGYSDMAIGLAGMIGIKMPQNFNSPYKSVSIVEFWTRWHMTLSRFLREYLYIPLGGNRRGAWRSRLNVMITMLLGGLWHGAAWTFVVWGGLHGLYIVVNRLWDCRKTKSVSLPPIVARAITFAAIVVAWVPFRSHDFAAAASMLHAMSGANGMGIVAAPVLLRAAAGLAIVWFAPNAQQLLANYHPVLEEPGRGVAPSRYQWQFTPAFGAAIGLLVTGTILFGNSVSEFLYFQF